MTLLLRQHLPLKASCNEQRVGLRFCGQKIFFANAIRSDYVQCMVTSERLPSFWANKENARWTEMRITYRGAISRWLLA